MKVRLRVWWRNRFSLLIEAALLSEHEIREFQDVVIHFRVRVIRIEGARRAALQVSDEHRLIDPEPLTDAFAFCLSGPNCHVGTRLL